MQYKWFLTFCLYAAIQVQLIVGYPNGYSNPGRQSRQVLNAQVNSDGLPVWDRSSNAESESNIKQSVNSNLENNGERRTEDEQQNVDDTVNPSQDYEASSSTNETPRPVHGNPTQNHETTSPANRNPKQYTGSQTKKHLCTISTENYDCQIQHVHLKIHQPIDFRSDNRKRNLTFQDSSLEYLPKSLIDAFPSMTLINLNDLRISSIEPNAFQNAAKLQTVYLEDNRLGRIEKGAFYGAKNLYMLVLSNNEITYFDGFSFNRYDALHYFYLDHNRLNTLPAFTNTLNLMYLNASHNNLLSIENNHFHHLRNLESLDLSFNQLKRLNLEQLNAPLDLVDVSSNELIHLVVPSNVKQLNAKNNSLTNFEVGQRCTMENLILARNRLDTAPELRKCQSLKYLDLSYNLLEVFNLTSSLSDLEYLYLAHNHLFEIHIPVKAQPFSMKELDLSYNQLSYGPSLSLLMKLEKIFLNDNKLISLRSYATVNHMNFQAYYMSNNEWNCGDITKFEQLTQDKNKDLCVEQMHAQNGICCRTYKKPYNDRLNEILREADFHERSNKKKCPKSESTTSNQRNQLDDIHNAIANSNAANVETLKQIESVRKNKNNYETQLQLMKDSRDRLDNSKRLVSQEIEKQRQAHRVVKEGLISDKDMLTRIIKFVQEKDTFLNDLLVRREQETQDSISMHTEKQEQLNDLNTNISNLRLRLATLKKDEKATKKQKDLLEREVNRNAPSIHGSSGSIST